MKGTERKRTITMKNGQRGDRTYMTMRTVLTTTLWTPPPRTGSAMTGSVSLTIMFARRSVTRSRCPFLRIGLILFAYSFCFLCTKAQTLVNEPYHVNYKDCEQT